MRVPVRAESSNLGENARRLLQRRSRHVARRNAVSWPPTIDLRNVQITRPGSGIDSQITFRHNTHNETFRLVYSGRQTKGSRQQASRTATAVYGEARTGSRGGQPRPVHYAVDAPGPR